MCRVRRCEKKASWISRREKKREREKGRRETKSLLVFTLFPLDARVSARYLRLLVARREGDNDNLAPPRHTSARFTVNWSPVISRHDEITGMTVSRITRVRNSGRKKCSRTRNYFVSLDIYFLALLVKYIQRGRRYIYLLNTKKLSLTINIKIIFFYSFTFFTRDIHFAFAHKILFTYDRISLFAQ